MRQNSEIHRMTIQGLKCDLSPTVTTCLQLKDCVRPDCCPIRDPIPYDAECFVRDIGQELDKLTRRHERMFVKRRRLMEMAIPRRRTCRFVPKCACSFQVHRDGATMWRPESHTHRATSSAHGPSIASQAANGHSGGRLNWGVHTEQMASLQLSIAVQSSHEYPAVG